MNFVLKIGICLRAIKERQRIPDGLMLYYPGNNSDQTNLTFSFLKALNMEENFTPSLLLALNDRIIPYSFLKMCIKSYLSNEKCQISNDTFINPLKVSEEVSQYFFN